MGAALLRDRDWAAIDGHICRVTSFNPLTQVEDGKVAGAGRTSPYALISMEIPGRLETTGAITHRADFLHLWKAFREIALDDTVEVNVAWIKSSLRPPAKWLAAFMPGLVVMVCKAGAFELITTTCQPELTGMARFEAERPLIAFKGRVYD
jgi:hypothetical protein